MYWLMFNMVPEIIVLAQATEDHPRQSEGTVLELKDGTLMIVWEEFDASKDKGEDHAPNHLSSMVSHDGGRTWGDYRRLIETEPGDLNTVGPNLLHLPDGQILLFFRRNHSFRPGVEWPSSGLVWSSCDEGRTFAPKATVWSRSSCLIGFASSTVKRLTTGRIILPVEKEDERLPHHYVTGVIYSDDDGRTWQHSNTWIDLPLAGGMEPHVEELRDGRLLMVMRTQMGSLFQSDSSDGGVTWRRARAVGFPSPESCPDLVRIPSTGDLLLILNRAGYDPDFGSHFGRRSPLTSAISDDDGQTWKNFKNIETDLAWAFSNPGCCFTSQHKTILNYWACKYVNRNGKSYMDVERIDLRLGIIDVDWFYS
jgi:sialidase-1